MKFNTALKFAGYALIGTCAVEGVYLLWRHWFSRRQGDSASFYDVLFFPDDKIACASEHTQTRGCLNPRCTFSHDPTLSYAKLLKWVKSMYNGEWIYDLNQSNGCLPDYFGNSLFTRDPISRACTVSDFLFPDGLMNFLNISLGKHISWNFIGSYVWQVVFMC